jgi:fatty acid desaturase
MEATMPEPAPAATTTEAAPLPIATGLNAAIAVAAIAVAIACLFVAAHAPHWSVLLAAAFVFSFANNTIFSLLHECVHGTFHPSARVNHAAGILFAAFFPTAFTFQRISHLGHHRRNRSDLELYDYYLPHQSRWLKTYWIYCLLTGFYWSIIPVALVVYVACPFLFRTRAFQNGPAALWGFGEYVRDLAARPIGRLWPEAAFTVAFQALLFWGLGLDWVSWLVCYWAFGVNWSSLQYTDHAWSPRDVHEGAWNLRFWPISQAIFLNYNLHLAHHRRPDIPWNRLPRFVSPADPNPSFWPIYLSLFGGARPAPASQTAKQKP